MTDRFSLRFATGEREGESVPIPAPRATLGRRAGNTIQVQDGSISGQHAEFVVEGGSITLRDLGSTNGTRVGGQKITEQRLAHGDRVNFGTVESVLLDAQLADSDTPASATPSLAAEGGEMERISADKLARSGKGSKTGLLVGLVLVLAVAGAAGFFLLGGEGGRARQTEAPLVVAGNLIPGGDFEGNTLPSNWTVQELGAADFVQRADARASGADGLRSALEAGERARLVSDPVSVSPGRSLSVAASLRARDGAAGRFGVEFLPDASSAEDAPGGTVAWSDSIVLATQHQRVEFSAPVPPGVRRARVVVEAAAGASEGGSVDIDDISLVAQGSSPAPNAKVGEFTLWILGEPAQSATLFKISKPLFGDLRGRGTDVQRAHSLSLTSADAGPALSAASSSSLSLRVEPEALRQGLASIGEGGFVEHSTTFERENAKSLLLAQGKDLVALHFAGPVRISGRPEDAGVRVEVSGSAASSVVIQLDFSADRAEAGNIAHAARKAESEGRLGDCIASWSSLLDEHPFEAALINEAREARARLGQVGLEELGQVSEAFERAKFFRLVDLFRQCRASAQAVASKYAGSEVEQQAQALSAQIDVALSELETDLNQDEIARLKAIRQALELTDSPRLAAEVRGYLNEEFGVEN